MVIDHFQAALDRFGSGHDADETLRNYLRTDYDLSTGPRRKRAGTRDRIPEPIQAWALGEALSEVGIEWMNGYSMLWAVGAYDAALSTTF
jgi:hypothetical protein